MLQHLSFCLFNVSLKLQYPFKSQGTNYGAFGSHMTTLLVMQNSIAMTTGLVQTWEKKKKRKKKDILSSQTILSTENISPDSSKVNSSAEVGLVVVAGVRSRVAAFLPPCSSAPVPTVVLMGADSSRYFSTPRPQ